MIALTRKRTKSAIVASFRGPKPLERLLELMQERRDKIAAGDDPKLKFKSKWGTTKRQLLRETHDKCAYCESHTAAVAFGDVEHYRPKSIYWWLAYVYDNYLASCSVCNQQFKSNSFEFSGVEMPGPALTGAETDAALSAMTAEFAPDPLDAPAIDAFTAAHRAEAPLIPNPYFDDPEAFFAWEALVGAKEVVLIPRPGVANAAEIVDACERLYGLNRPQLKRRRYIQWRNYSFARAVSQDATADAALRAEADELIASFLAPESEYAAMIRFFEAL
jgi:hypothetical protein